MPSLGVRPVFLFVRDGRDGGLRHPWGVGSGRWPRGVREERDPRASCGSCRMSGLEWSPGDHMQGVHISSRDGLAQTEARAPLAWMSLTYFSQLPPGLQWSSVNSLFTAASPLWKWGVSRNRVGGSQSDRVTTWPQINVSLVNKNWALHVRWVYHWEKHVSFYIYFKNPFISIRFYYYSSFKKPFSSDISNRGK